MKQKPEWEIGIYYQNKLDRTETFQTKELAMERFNALASTFKLGLVGWSVSYPRRSKP